MGSIDKSSTGTNVGGADPDDRWYEDWTAYSTNVITGQSYNITITNYYTSINIDIAIWIDANRDGDFSDTGEQLRKLIII